MKEDNICQKSRQDLGPLCDFSFSCLIQISRALLQSRRICLPSLKKPIRRPETNKHFCYQTAVADPDGRGGGGGGGTQPRWLRGGPVLKNFFQPLGHHFVLKITGGGPPGPLPGTRHWTATIFPQDCRAGEHVTCERVRLLCALTRKMQHAHPRDSDGLLIFHHRLLRLVTKK